MRSHPAAMLLTIMAKIRKQQGPGISTDRSEGAQLSSRSSAAAATAIGRSPARTSNSSCHGHHNVPSPLFLVHYSPIQTSDPFPHVHDPLRRRLHSFPQLPPAPISSSLLSDRPRHLRGKEINKSVLPGAHRHHRFGLRHWLTSTARRQRCRLCS